MRTIGLLLLIISIEYCHAQTDTNLLAAGEWSDTVSDSEGRALRGRLLVYDEQNPPDHARIYLELQHVFKGAWPSPAAIYFDVGPQGGLNFKLLGNNGRPVPQEPVVIRGLVPAPWWITLPCDSIVRLRADMYTLGSSDTHRGLRILVANGCWLVRSNATNRLFLQATFSPTNEHPCPLPYHVRHGTLTPPRVNLSVNPSDEIDRLVVQLSRSYGLWQNGLSPIIHLPRDAPVEQVLSRVFKMTGFDAGHVKNYRVLKTRKVRITGSVPDVYTAALVDTDLGRKIVLLRPYQNPTDGWWTRVYDAAPIE